MVRTKVLAILLGPLGIGISGLYQSALDLIKTATGFGLGYSGVKEVAEAAADGNRKKIAAVILVLKRWSWATGLIGIIVTVVFSRQISNATFGDDKHTIGISILSITLLLSALATSRSALLQGLRQISKMAKAIVWSAILSLIGASVIYYFAGLKGIIPAIVLVAALELIINWYYSKDIKTAPVSMTLERSFAMGKTMVKLGFFMTVSLLANTASMYFVRSFIVRQDGLDTIGYFVAAWTISSVYIAAIFNAMSADYFPRLSSVQHNSITVRKLVNDQTEIALLLTVPIIISMIGFIDWLVPLFYSKQFSTTATILSWQLAGDFFKVLSWPLGFILLAKGKGMLFLFTELVWNVLFCASVYFGLPSAGIEITGIGFLAAYVIYLVILYVIVRRLVQFQWTPRVWKSIFFFLPLVTLAYLSTRVFTGGSRLVCVSLLFGITAIYSYRHLQHLVDISKIMNRIRLRFL
jgi:PST family polysaccharide transporter